MQRTSASLSALPRVTGKPPERRQEPAGEAFLPQRVLAHVAQPPPGHDAHDRRVHVGAVDGRQHERARAGTCSRPSTRHAEPHPAEAHADGAGRAGRRPATATSCRPAWCRRRSCRRVGPALERARGAGRAAPRSGRRSPRPRGRWCPRARRRRPPAAGCRPGWSRARRGRRSWPWSARSRGRPPPCGGAPPARPATAVRYTLSSASGNTTEPMSRPSITPPPCFSAHSRCRYAQLGPHAGVGGHDAHRAGHLRTPDLEAGVDPVDGDRRVDHVEVQRPRPARPPDRPRRGRSSGAGRRR